MQIMSKQTAFRTLILLTAIAPLADPAKAQNLHRKYGPSWDCGYISYGLPYKDLCEQCEARGQEFEQIGNSGRCVDKPNAIDAGRRSLRETLRERLLEKSNPGSDDKEDDQERVPPIETPSPRQHPSYGKSGISSRKGGAIRSDPSAAVDPQTAAREQRRQTLQILKFALTQMQARKWADAKDSLSETISSSSNTHTMTHALWLEDMASGEAKLEELLENEAEWRSSSDIPVSVVLERLSAPQEAREHAGAVAAELPALSRIDEMLKKRWQKINTMAEAAHISANLQDLSFKGYGAALERCRDMGGIIVDDIIKGEDRRPRRFCTVRPISQREIHELISEYEKAMQQ